MFTLYTTPLSANGRKVLAVSHHLGLSPEVKLVNVYKGDGQTPEYLSINPFGKIPTLVDGGLTLWESNAILQYLSEAHGEYRLWSRDPRQRADISRWLFWESSHWQPAIQSIPGLGTFVGQRLGVVPAEASAPPVEPGWDEARFHPLVKFLDTHLNGRGFLVSDALTLADFCVAGMMMYLRPAGFPFEAFPHLAAWYERIERLEAWRVTADGPWRY